MQHLFSIIADGEKVDNIRSNRKQLLKKKRWGKVVVNKLLKTEVATRAVQ